MQHTTQLTVNAHMTSGSNRHIARDRPGPAARKGLCQQHPVLTCIAFSSRARIHLHSWKHVSKPRRSWSHTQPCAALAVNDAADGAPKPHRQLATYSSSLSGAQMLPLEGFLFLTAHYRTLRCELSPMNVRRMYVRFDALCFPCNCKPSGRKHVTEDIFI